MVPGSLLIGRLGDEYTCTHEHHICGDECLCFKLAPGLVEAVGDGADVGRPGPLRLGRVSWCWVNWHRQPRMATATWRWKR